MVVALILADSRIDYITVYMVYYSQSFMFAYTPTQTCWGYSLDKPWQLWNPTFTNKIDTSDSFNF